VKFGSSISIEFTLSTPSSITIFTHTHKYW